jgi:hypothetical protein
MSEPIAPIESLAPPPLRNRTVTLGLLALAAIAGAAAIYRLPVDPRRFAFSYLTALAFVTTVTIGALAWLMIHHVTGAIWSVCLRRLMENLTQPLVVIAALFVPVALNVQHLYPWANPARVAADPALLRKTVWLNPTLFDLRAVVCLGTWLLLAALLSRASLRLDRTSDVTCIDRMRATSSWGLVALGLTTSLAAFDWLMSLDANWSSTIFAVYFWAGSLVAALAALILLALGLRTVGALEGTLTVEHLHDLGKLLFGFVIFWAYVAFSQYFLIWYANFSEEAEWYVVRRSGAWNTLSWALVFGHFVVPFILLLPRANKRDPFWLGFVALWVLVFHYADLYWLIMPAQQREGMRFQWLDGALLLTLALPCAAIVVRACATRSPVATGDPRLAQSVAFRNS